MNYSLLRKLRKSFNFSQEQVASTLGISRQAYSHYECGKCQPPMDILMKISALYEININELFNSEQAYKKTKYRKVSDIQEKIEDALEMLDVDVQKEIFDFILFKLARITHLFI